jgi:hypothetical protein
MAAIDALNVFSGGFNAAGAVSYQTVTGTSTTVLGSNSIDTTGGLGAAQPTDLGKGEELDIVAQVGTAFVGATSIEIQYISADDAALTTNVTVLGSSGAIPIAKLAAGAQVVVPVPPVDPRALRRYVGVQYVIVGAGSAGSFFTALQRRHGDLPQPAYKSGFTVA